MNAQQYIDHHGKANARRLMARVKSSYPYLYQIANGIRTPSVPMLKRLILASRKLTPDAPLTGDGLLGL